MARTKNSVPLNTIGIENPMVIGRLFGSGKKAELEQAFDMAFNVSKSGYIANVYYEELSPVQKQDFIKGLLCEMTTVNLHKDCEEGIRFRIKMTDERLSKFKDHLCWVIQEELCPNVNYVTLSGQHKGFYLTTAEDRDMFRSYLFGHNQYAMEVDFNVIVAQKIQQARNLYGVENIKRVGVARRKMTSRRNGYSRDFARSMNLSIAV